MSKRSTKEDASPARVAVPDQPDLAVAETISAIDGTHWIDRPHQMEIEVRQRLMSHPHLNFSSLVIRRIGKGVCLEGVLEAEDESPDVCDLAQQVSGVEEVRNHLVMRSNRRPPAKG